MAETKKKKRRKKHFLLRIFLFIGLCAGLFYFLRSDFFLVRDIAVEGEEFYTAEQIISTAGTERGVNLFETDLGAMRDALLKDPYIAVCQVKRVLPGTVRITVQERKEVCAANYDDPDGSVYLILDKNGLILRRTSVQPGLPLLQGMTVTETEPGKAFSCEENALFAQTLQLVNQVESADLYFKRILLSKVIVTAYIYDTLVAEGEPANILNSLDALHDVILDLKSKSITRGTIKMSGDGSAIYSPNERN